MRITAHNKIPDNNVNNNNNNNSNTPCKYVAKQQPHLLQYGSVQAGPGQEGYRCSALQHARLIEIHQAEQVVIRRAVARARDPAWSTNSGRKGARSQAGLPSR